MDFWSVAPGGNYLASLSNTSVYQSVHRIRENFFFPDWGLHKFPRAINGPECEASDNWQIVRGAKHLWSHDFFGWDGWESADSIYRRRDSRSVRLIIQANGIEQWLRVNSQRMDWPHVRGLFASPTHWEVRWQSGNAEKCRLGCRAGCQSRRWVFRFLSKISVTCDISGFAGYVYTFTTVK